MLRLTHKPDSECKGVQRYPQGALSRGLDSLTPSSVSLRKLEASKKGWALSSYLWDLCRGCRAAEPLQWLRARAGLAVRGTAGRKLGAFLARQRRPKWGFPKVRGALFGVLIIRTLLFRVLIRVPYFRKPPCYAVKRPCTVQSPAHAHRDTPKRQVLTSAVMDLLQLRLHSFPKEDLLVNRCKTANLSRLGLYEPHQFFGAFRDSAAGQIETSTAKKHSNLPPAL